MSYKNFKRDLSNYLGGGIVVTGLALGGASLAHAQQPAEKYTFGQVRDAVNAGTVPEDMKEDANRYVLNLAPDFIWTFGDHRKGGIATTDSLPEMLGVARPDTNTFTYRTKGRNPVLFSKNVDVVPVGHDSIQAMHIGNWEERLDDAWNFLIVQGRYPTGESFDIRGSIEDWRRKVDPNAPGSKNAFDALTAYVRMRDALNQEPKRREKAAQ